VAATAERFHLVRGGRAIARRLLLGGEADCFASPIERRNRRRCSVIGLRRFVETLASRLRDVIAGASSSARAMRRGLAAERRSQELSGGGLQPVPEPMPASPRLIAGLSSSASAGPIGCTSGDVLGLGVLPVFWECRGSSP